MANADKPRGFVPAGHRNGGTIRSTTFNIAYDYATPVYCGDAVVLSSGKVVAAAATDTAILGIFAGCRYRDNTGAMIFSRYWPGVALSDSAAVVTADVYTDKGILFEVQCDVAYVDATHIGTTGDLVATAGASAITGQSTQEFTNGTTGDAQFVVYQLIDRPDNAAGAHAKVLVSINDSAI